MHAYNASQLELTADYWDLAWLACMLMHVDLKDMATERSSDSIFGHFSYTHIIIGTCDIICNY